LHRGRQAGVVLDWSGSSVALASGKAEAQGYNRYGGEVTYGKTNIVNVHQVYHFRLKGRSASENSKSTSKTRAD